MVGRKPAVDSSRIISAVLKFKDKVIEIKNNEKKIVVASNKVWSDICNHLGGSKSKNALYIFVQQGRYGIHEKLEIIPTNTYENKIINVETLVESDESSNSSSEDIEHLPYKQFVITISAEEWTQIKPKEVLYKNVNNLRSYFVLPKGSWTDLLAEHIWLHTHLPCSIAFRRAKVFYEGNYFIDIVGKCNSCDSNFKGVIKEVPPENTRVLIECTYTGDFDKPHTNIKKRRITGQSKLNAISNIVQIGKSSESYREMAAVRLMQSGDPEPAIIPSGGALRTLKWRHKFGDRRHKDTITALALMKKEDEYKNVLQDMSCYPFYIHYESSEQIHIYRDYCKHCPTPKIIFDATGSVVNNFKKFDIEKTTSLFLYEALVYDATKQHSFTISNMLSERHTNIAIFNWLGKWLSCNIPPPKESICDQSLALISGIIQCFTQYSSLQEYLNACADLTLGQLPIDSHWLPHCFVRTDIAHFMKMISRWPPLKTTPRRVKEIILRTFGLLIKSQSLEEMYLLVLSLFVVLSSESDGNSIDTDHETPCEHHKKILIQATSTGFINVEDEINQIILTADTEDVARILIEEEYERQYEGLDNISHPFKSWAEDILNRSKSLLTEGSGINAMYLPTLIPYIVKCLKLLPLWSGLMIPIFGYGDETASSAAVESSFKKLKLVTFKDTPLPTNIEIFLEKHILSLRGTSLFRSARKNIVSDKTVNENQYTVEIELDVNNNTHDEDEEQNIREEDSAVESWNRRSKKQRTTNSYLVPNPHLQHLNINKTRNILSLPLLKNGSRADELKSCIIKNIGKVIMSNTCAFDTIASIIMVAYCDSVKYSHEIDNLLQNKFFAFISKMVKNGITSSTYSEIADIIISEIQPSLEYLEYETTLAVCDTTVGNIINKLFHNFPSVVDIIQCSNPTCKKTTDTPIPVFYITIRVLDGDLSSLQQDIEDRIRTMTTICGHVEKDQLPCVGNKTVSSTISSMHIFIELLIWDEENEINNSLHSSEAARHSNIILSDIPPVLKINEKSYELRGVCCYRQGLSRLRNSVGHYYAYGARGENKWELFDDTKKK